MWRCVTLRLLFISPVSLVFYIVVIWNRFGHAVYFFQCQTVKLATQCRNRPKILYDQTKLSCIFPSLTEKKGKHQNNALGDLKEFLVNHGKYGTLSMYHQFVCKRRCTAHFLLMLQCKFWPWILTWFSVAFSFHFLRFQIFSFPNRRNE